MKINYPLPFSARCIALIALFALHANAYAQSWEYFHDPVQMPKYVSCVKVDAAGKLWYASSSILGQFDGINWHPHNFQAAGINVLYNTLKSLAPAPDGSIWCGSQDRVLHYQPGSNTWTLHNPSNSAVNLNSFDITVDGNGDVYWSVGGGWYYWDGLNWVRGYFYLNNAESQGIEENSTRKIITDPFGDHWSITSGSIAIETGDITPAGIVRRSATDTTVYKMGNFGFPNILGLPATKNAQGYPMVLVATADANGQNRRFRLLSYEFGGWQALGDSPVTAASVLEVFQDQIGNVWLGGTINQDQPVVYRRKPDGSWVTYLLDKQQMTYLYSITGSPTGDIWVGGRLGTEGVLAKLPPQPISATTEVSPNCPTISAFQAEGELHLQNIPEGENVQVIALDVQGRTLGAWHWDSERTSVEVTNWPTGLYFLHIVGQSACPKQTVKFVKQ